MWRAYALLAFVLACLLAGPGCNNQRLAAIEWAEYGYTIHPDLSVTCNDIPDAKYTAADLNGGDLVCHWPCAYVADEPKQITATFFQRDHHVQVVHEIGPCLEE